MRGVGALCKKQRLDVDGDVLNERVPVIQDIECHVIRLRLLGGIMLLKLMDLLISVSERSGDVIMSMMTLVHISRINVGAIGVGTVHRADRGVIQEMRRLTRGDADGRATLASKVLQGLMASGWIIPWAA